MCYGKNRVAWAFGGIAEHGFGSWRSITDRLLKPVVIQQVKLTLGDRHARASGRALSDSVTVT